jgi:putative heme iron utilization protein
MNKSPSLDETLAEARGLLKLTRAGLGSLADRDGTAYPFVSLVLPALAADGEIVLLLSDLSDHAKNLKRDGKASLLFDGTLELKEPLTGPRLTLIGEVRKSDDQAADKALYVAAQPSAAMYAGFGDFHCYRFKVQEGLFVAGFGRIHRIAPHQLAAA